MNKPSAYLSAIARFLWYKTAVPVFIERYLLGLLGSATLLVLVVNPMNFDWIQRITLGVAILALAAFFAQTLHRYNLSSKDTADGTRKESKEVPQPTATPTPQSQLTASPGFSEKLTQVIVSLGESGFSQNIRSENLGDKKYPIASPTDPKHPLGYAYVENGTFYFDADIFYSFDYPPIKVSHNEISDRPANWDYNFDDVGFEIVDEKQRPRLQFYYTSPSRIVIKGIFLSGRHLWFVDKDVRAYLVDAISEMPDDMKPPKEFNIKRLFKYPSMRYKGQRAE